MRLLSFLTSITAVVLSVFIYKHLQVDLIDYCELEKCPFCYGTDLCELFLNLNINLTEDNLNEFITNRFSVKNVLYARLFKEKIVLKKLAHSSELNEFDRNICTAEYCNFNSINYTEEIINILSRKSKEISNFKVCSETAAIAFLQEISSPSFEDNLIHLWTTIKINAEPLLLQVRDLFN